MSVDFKTFLQIVPHITNVRKPVLLRGRHGVGKSEVVYQFASTVGLPVVERRASQMTEGDLLGLPKLDDNVTAWCAPDWLAHACNEPVVLFLDEVDRATLRLLWFNLHSRSDNYLANDWGRCCSDSLADDCRCSLIAVYLHVVCRTALHTSKDRAKDEETADNAIG